jgi:hypothetical protein
MDLGARRTVAKSTRRSVRSTSHSFSTDLAPQSKAALRRVRDASDASDASDRGTQGARGPASPDISQMN